MAIASPPEEPRIAAWDRRVDWWLTALALVMQSCYLTVQILSYIHDLGDFSPGTNAYGSVYFTLLGAHHIHIVVGLLLDLWLLVRLSGGLTSSSHADISRTTRGPSRPGERESAGHRP